MADFGANHPCFKPNTVGTAGVVLGRLVSANLTVNLASGEIYADDELAEQASEFSSGSLAMETDDMSDANASVVYGATINAGEVIYNKNDSAPMGSLAYYKVLMRHGIKYYKGYYYPRVKAALGNDNAQTKGNSVSFQSTNTAFTVFTDDNGDWRKTETFSTAAAAIAWCETKCSVAKYYPINISVQGAGAGEGVSPVGTVYVASGEAFVLTITGYAGITAAYDNAVDKTTDITSGSGTYTVQSVAAAHSIVVIF